MKLINHWIDGTFVSATPNRTGPVFNPATGIQTSEVAMATIDDVDLAVGAASRAFESWSDTPLTRRQNIMFAFRELIARNRNELAAAMTAEHGKTIDDALGEVQRGLEVIEFACNIAHLLKGDLSEQVSTGVDTYSVRQPLGVVAGITPFNFPIMVPMWMFPIAIACGNTFVLKPSEKDPTVSQMVAELFTEAGLPNGVFNVVHGDKESVDALLAHPDVAAISFVGSTPIARYIHETGTQNGKRVQALGGAKNHMVVLPDADMDLAADAAVSAGYGSAGERCMAISVVVAVGDAGDRLLPKIEERIEKLRTGSAQDWLAALEAARIPCARVNNVAQALADPQIQHRNMVVDVEHPEGGSVKVPGNPIKLSETPAESFTPPPLLGAHTKEIFASWAGMSEDEISKGLDTGAIA